MSLPEERDRNSTFPGFMPKGVAQLPLSVCVEVRSFPVAW